MSEKTTYVIELNDKMSPKLKAATAQALGLDKAVGGVGRKGVSSFSMLSGAISSLAGPLAIAAAGMKAFNFASDSIKATRNFEALENSITFAAGSAEEGGKTMDFLRKSSRKMGTDLLASAEGFKTLSGAMMGTALEGEATKDIFTSIQTASTVMGLDAEQSKGALLALGQMMGKGKVQAEELRGQLGERIPGAFDIAARSMGMTTTQLDKFMADGKILAVDFLPKFSKELKKTFGPGLEKASKSSTAQFNRFNNTILELKLKIGRFLMPTLNRLMEWFTGVFDYLEKNSGKIAAFFKPWTDAMHELKGALNDVSKELEGAIDLASIFNGIMKAFSFSVKATAGTVAIFSKAIKGLKKAIKPIQAVTKSIRIGFKTAINTIILLIDRLIQKIKIAAQGFSELRKGNFKKGFNIIGEANIEAVSSVNKELGKGFRQAVESERPPRFSDTQKDNIRNKIATGFFKKWDENKNGGTGTGTGEGEGTGTGTGIDGIKSGRPTNVNINIGKLIEEQNITAGNVEDMVNQIQDLVTKALLSSVNNANLIAR